MERIIIVAAAALVCCGCADFRVGEYISAGSVNSSEGIGTGDGEDSTGVGGINIWLNETKVAVSESLVLGDTLDIYVYNDDELRQMDTYERVTLGTITNDRSETGSGSGTVDVACTAGPKIIAMVVNGRTGRYCWSASNTYNYIGKLDAEFEKEDPEHPTMSGKCCTEGNEKSLGIELQPIMSKVVLRSIRCDFTGRAYEGEYLTDAKVYLTNVSSLCRMMAFSGFNTRGVMNAGRLVESDLARMKDPGMVVQDLPKQIGKDFLEVNRTLYCYPNTNTEDSIGSPFTRLVIEGKIEGKTWYYPININREDFCWVEGTEGIERNKCYVYDITIKRTGSSDPDTPVYVRDISIAAEVVPWKEKEDRDEIF